MAENVFDGSTNRYRAGLWRITMVGLLIALGLILHFVEAMLPLLPIVGPVPGAKLGLANIITLMALMILGIRGGGLVLFFRIFLGGILSGTFLTFPFYLSFIGGTIAFSFMAIALFFGKRYLSIIGISILGAIGHNTGQILAAAWFVGSWGTLYYFPYLLLLSLPTGFFIGLVARMALSMMRGVNL